ncbi:MAG TPA: aromatic ring-hydroxylating dioxygenase subunit alpha [Rudaea sp.]|nr:aromatic ring-hydroxylating dioxygenase subunit alpha [Rudaea sp.]
MDLPIDPGWLASTMLEHASALPAPLYTNPEVMRRECRDIFARSWQLVAHAAQVREPGDHVVAEIAGVPLVLVRGDDHVLRALHNVCRHRAGPLASCDGHGLRALRCKYHGWTYRLDGQLRSAPEMDDCADFHVEDVRLPQAQVTQWNGLVFAALDPRIALDDVLAGIDARIADSSMRACIFSHRIGYDIACNWKVYVDNFLEGYHLPHVHPALNRMLDYRGYVTELADWHSLQHSALESADTLYGNGEALYYFVWPNTMLNILPGRLQTNRVIPLGVDRCRVEFDYYYPDGTEIRARDQDFSDEVQREDIAICEQVQRGLASGSYFAGRLNPRRENGVHHFHELYRAALRATGA